jgi:hypothetical protein
VNEEEAIAAITFPLRSQLRKSQFTCLIDACGSHTSASHFMIQL